MTFNQQKFCKAFEKVTGRKPTAEEIQYAQWQYMLPTISESVAKDKEEERIKAEECKRFAAELHEQFLKTPAGELWQSRRTSGG